VPLAELIFLTPRGALVALAVAVPLAVIVLAELRSDRLRSLLRLGQPSTLSRLEMPAAVCAVCGLLGLAAAQPVVRADRPRLTRKDAQAFVAIDISRSMLASASATSPTRLARAKRIADELRARLADVPVGVATFTDRALPLLFPTASIASFTSTVAKAVGIEQPPPRGESQTVTTFDSLATIPTTGYFSAGIRHRLVIVVTDGESEGIDADGVKQSYSTARPRPSVLVVKVGSSSEHVFGPDGIAETGYIVPPASGRVLREFLGATRGRLFGDGDVAGIVRAARAELGAGPRQRLGTISGRNELAPWFVLAAIVPLGLILRRRNG
jgi:hypothetical protein